MTKRLVTTSGKVTGTTKSRCVGGTALRSLALAACFLHALSHVGASKASGPHPHQGKTAVSIDVFVFSRGGFSTTSVETAGIKIPRELDFNAPDIPEKHVADGRQLLSPGSSQGSLEESTTPVYVSPILGLHTLKTDSGGQVGILSQSTLKSHSNLSLSVPCISLESVVYLIHGIEHESCGTTMSAAAP